MTAVQLAVALCVLATIVNGCAHHDGALVADSTAQIPTPAHKRYLLSTAQSNRTLIVRKCGAAPTSDFRKKAIQLRVQPHIAARAASAERSMKTTNVNVYVTINRNGVLGDVSQGDISDSNVARQIDFVNRAYRSTQFSFTLVSTTRIRVAAWWDVDSSSQAYIDFKEAAHQGNYADLNIMTTTLRNNLLGVTTVPWDGSVRRDAAMINPFSWIGGQFQRYNLGATTVHEVGHWFGLFHPFDNGCTEPNDYVGDTAEEAAPQYDCPSPPPNSCPNKPAGQPTLDTIHSYMDYSPDACMNQFTPGQITRMGAMWDAYRAAFHKSVASSSQLKPVRHPSRSHPVHKHKPQRPVSGSRKPVSG